MKKSKRYQKSKKLIDTTKTYSFAEAVELLKKLPPPKFDPSVEIHIKLGIDLGKSDQQVRGTIILPHTLGQEKKIAAFVTPAKEKEAKEAGAILVGGEELVKKIKSSGRVDFEVAVAEPMMMKSLAQIAKILGPKGLMPSPKTETVTKDIKKIIGELKSGKITFKVDKGGNLHQIIGKVSQETKKLEDNFKTFLEAVKRAKPQGSKGVFIQKITLSSTMGPGIKISA